MATRGHSEAKLNRGLHRDFPAPYIRNEHTYFDINTEDNCDIGNMKVPQVAFM